MVAADRFLSRDQTELSSILMLNWIAWNGSVMTFKLHTWTVFVFSTELFEIGLFMCIKIDLALITYNGWYARKPNQTKQNQVSRTLRSILADLNNAVV